MNILLNLIVGLICLYAAFGVLYQLIFSISGHFSKPKLKTKSGKLKKFAIFIAAYKEDAIIYQTARRAICQRYPDELFDVFVLADKMKKETIDQLKLLPLEIVEMDFKESTKSKSLRKGLEYARSLNRNYDSAVVLDADNIMAPDFLTHANRFLGAGYKAIQGQRTAPVGKKNDTAEWDAISESINNHILCEGHYAVGLSARLAGSGMIFDYDLFESIMQDVHAIGGFDKDLELRLTQAGQKIAYAKNAKVYDEKVASSEVFARQRGRWLAAQYNYAYQFAPKGMRDLVIKGNLDFFVKSIQMLLPPRLLLPVACVVMMTVCIPINMTFSAVFACLFLLNVSTFLLAIPIERWNGASFSLISKLPVLILKAVKAVFLIPSSTKTFYHTPHAEVIETKN